MSEYPVASPAEVPQRGAHLDLADIFQIWPTITDETGVPLESDRVTSTTDIDFEYMECPYHDSPSRMQADTEDVTDKKPMSGLEYRRLQQSYPSVRRLLLATRNAYVQFLTQSGSTEAELAATVAGGQHILAAIRQLPVYLVARAGQPVPAQNALPRHLIVASNCAGGAISALDVYSFGDSQLPLPSGQAALEEIEYEGSMVGPKTVCAAPPKMITGFLDMLAHGEEKVKVGDIETETNGLVTTDELPLVMAFASLLGEAHPLSLQLSSIDAEHLKRMQQYDPQLHSPQHAQEIVQSLKAQLAPLVGHYEHLSAQLNLFLDREPLRPGEFSTRANNMFQTMNLARQKGLDTKIQFSEQATKVDPVAKMLASVVLRSRPTLHTN